MAFKEASEIFDLYIDWDRRLAREMPCLISRLRSGSCRRVADVACGTGAHAVALARAGFSVVAVDPDPALLGKAVEEAGRAGVELDVYESTFADLAAVPGPAFDAVICMGNSISLVGPGVDLSMAMGGMAALLKPSGLLLLHTVNYPMLAKRSTDPWGPVRSLQDGGLILKGFLPRKDGPWDVLLIHLVKEEGTWRSRPVRFQVHPHEPSNLEDAVRGSGLALRSIQGGFLGERPEDPRSSDLLYELEKIVEGGAGIQK